VDNDNQPIKISATRKHSFEVQYLNGPKVESIARELTLRRGEKRLLKVTLVDGEVKIVDAERKPSVVTIPGTTDPGPKDIAEPSPRTPTDLLLVDSKLVTDAVGPPVDLIQRVDLSRDAFAGEWKKQGTSLVCDPESVIYFPTRLPEDYQLKFRLKRVNGGGAIWFGFVMEGRLGFIGFDYWGSICGLSVDGKDPKEGNCTARNKHLFTEGQPSEIILTVHPGHLHASFDGQSVIDWHGAASRLNWSGWTNRETPLIYVARAKVQIDSAVLIPIKPEPHRMRLPNLERTINLMPLLDTERDSFSGVWAMNKNRLRSPLSGQTIFSLPVLVPEEYTLSATVELSDEAQEKSTFVVGLVAGKSCCSIALVNDYCLGLERIDGKRWNENETTLPGVFFKKGKPTTIACTVTKREISMQLDGRTLLHWAGDFRRLTPQVDWVPTDARKLFFGAGTHFKLSDINLGPPVDPPNLPAHPPLTQGRPVDLLSLIDPARDALVGTWKKEVNLLRAMGDVTNNKLVVPLDVPAEYKLNITVVREAGGRANENLHLRLPIDSTTAAVVLDGFGMKYSGILLDHLDVNDNRNPTSRDIKAIPMGTPQEIVAYVRKTGLKVVSGDKTIIDWEGSPTRYWQNRYFGTPDEKIVIGSWDTRFRFDKIEIEPLKASSFPPVAQLSPDGNLISVIDTQRDSRKGEWKKGAEGLLSPILPGARLRVPVTPPKQYVLTADIERTKGTGPLCIGLLVSGHPGSAEVDSYKPHVMDDFKSESYHTGLAMLDGKSFLDGSNLTHHACPVSLFPSGKRIPIRCVVLSDTILLTCGDKEIVSWHGDPRRLSTDPDYLPSNYSEADRSQLWLGASETEFHVHEFRLKPLSDAEAKTIADRFTGVFPVDSAKAKLEEQQRVINEVLPGFTVSNSNNGLGPFYLKEYLGRSNVLIVHPASQSVPCVFSVNRLIPSGKKTKLQFEVTHHIKGDWQLIVKANGEQLLKKDIGPKTCQKDRTATQRGWCEIDVDLSKFAGQNVQLELQSAATGWAWEWAIWSGVKSVTTDN
jgi:hypothetical protein